ncbi:hypothetical protein CVT24_007453 [Panaeolus cyanescens]|uniref:TEA domain-containing protein n=1 Tax=Panaeolus cyanescens TaxID=181874 RepID=A0A409W4V4_9AGAR|nr:hypothetical protein CVT24_007453 [Panaeolus cyanescens]
MASSPAPSSASSAPSSPSSTRRGSASHAFKCPALPNSRTQDVFQSIVKGRKSWKTLRGGEVVWPPELEAALIEGLENYQPDDSRETRLLGRFPMRNRFISDWIYEKTGKRRTAKQVGSRLQQLRDTCGGKRLLNLLSPNRRPCRTSSLSPEFQHRDNSSNYGPPPLRYESESCSDSSGSTPATPTEAHATLQSLLYRGVEPRVEETPETIVCIDLLPEELPNGQSPLKPSGEQAAEEQQWLERGYKVVHAAQQPRYLRDIDPTITLLSHSPTTAQSHFTVYTDDGIVFSETTDLEIVESSSAHEPMDGGLLYRTSLVPGYWGTIGQSADASQYVIIQRVIQEDPSTGTSSTVFAAMYRFNYTTSSQPEDSDQSVYQATHLMTADQTNHKTEFASYEAMIPMEADGSFSDMMGFVKPQQYFDMNMNPYMRPEEWGSSESVYASPVDCNKPNPCMISGSDEQLLSPTASYMVSDVPPYVL